MASEEILSDSALAQYVESGKQILIFDIRSPEEFASGHIPGAINVDRRNIPPTLPDTIPIVIICEDGERSSLVAAKLRDVGLMAMHLDGGMKDWRGKLLRGYEMTPTLSPQDVKRKLDGNEPIVILDVREPDEYAEWRIESCVNIPLAKVLTSVESLPRDKEVVTICSAGIRSAVAAQQLRKAGFNAKNMLNGMIGWNSVYDIVTMPQTDLEGRNFDLKQFRRLGKGCLSYMIGSRGLAAVIDPSQHVEEYIQQAHLEGWKITHVFDTHLHADHVSGARTLAERVGASLCLNPSEYFRFGFTPLSDGQEIQIGEVQVMVKIIYAPGHTRGSTLFLVDGKVLLTGDTVFIDSVGRPDLANKAMEFASLLYDSLHCKILPLPDETAIFPAHYSEAVKPPRGQPIYASLGHLRRNLLVLGMAKDAFIEHVASKALLPKPANCDIILKINSGEMNVEPAEAIQLESGPNRCGVASL